MSAFFIDARTIATTKRQAQGRPVPAAFSKPLCSPSSAMNRIFGTMRNEAAFLLDSAGADRGGLECSDLSPLRNLDAWSDPVCDEHSWLLSWWKKRMGFEVRLVSFLSESKVRCGEKSSGEAQLKFDVTNILCESLGRSLMTNIQSNIVTTLYYADMVPTIERRSPKQFWAKARSPSRSRAACLCGRVQYRTTGGSER
ncbi:hypothetical protein P692DRAFT_201888750 [Suillus brevipes Sb2]|nr:hypothetical protein P692DRAFT_201888750 [Suillus brevipes Sb2]